MGNYIIERLKAEDAELFKSFRLEMLQTNPEAFGGTYEETIKLDISSVEERLDSNGVYGLFDDESLVSVAGYRLFSDLKSQHRAFMWGVYTSPEYRGKGYGKTIIQHTIQNLPDAIEILQTSVVSVNENGHQVYKNLGFKEYGIAEKSLKMNDKYYDEILMVKFLK